MPAYKVIVLKATKKQLSSIPKHISQRISGAIDSLARNPRPHGVEKLSGDDNLYRIRVGNYRIVYSIQDNLLIVLVVRVGPRKDVYRKL